MAVDRTFSVEGGEGGEGASPLRSYESSNNLSNKKYRITLIRVHAPRYYGLKKVIVA